MEILNTKKLKEAVLKTSLVLEKGGVIVYPTDTLYGIGADATNENAIDRIIKIKKRKDDKFSAIIEKSKIKEYAIIPKKYFERINNLLPGPYTFLLKAKKKLPIVKDSIIGVRVPKNRFCTLLAKTFKKPIISTSANISGKNPHYMFDSIPNEIKKKVDLLIDGGKCKYQKGSTIIDLVNKKILRIGAGYKKAKRLFGDFT